MPADWPVYRCDNARSACSRSRLFVKSPVRKWEYRAGEGEELSAPVSAGEMIFLGGRGGVVRALDETTGQEKWHAFTGGEVRYPPAIAKGCALFGSFDGWVYAVEAATGRSL
jgi:outer membrane protein assembly factor BamB